LAGIVDTYPIYVSQPRSHKISKLLFNPKYGGCVVKFIMAIDFLGTKIGYWLNNRTYYFLGWTFLGLDV
jgi:hypothetical protein